ncbi:helix-turn-helix transcriptional regulator [Devosia alba]|uniref:helix-turn-helix transcriptional regulator n=1 Tax=Devosia alba TaxID=3152360 RepID=UPI003266F54D
MKRQWMFSSNSERVIGEFDTSGRIRMDDGPYRGFLDHLPVRAGLSLFLAEGGADSAYSLAALGEPASDNLILGCMLSGTGILEAVGNPNQVWRASGQLYALSLSNRPVRYHLEADQPFRSVALMLTPDAVEALAEDHDLPELTRSSRRTGPISMMRPMGPLASKVAMDLLQPLYRGPMERLYREGKATELLALQIGLLGQPLDKDLTSAELRRVREARELLVTDLRNPPDLAGLAAAVGLRVKRLNQGFRQIYGTTVFDHLLDVRMTTARDMLDQGLDMPLKQLAWAMGYRQASNFISAFRTRFGISPGAYGRRSRD